MNDAAKYGVAVQRAEPNGAGYVWRALLIKHLEPSENGGNHHIYCDVYGEDGRELRGSTGVRVAWDWNGRRSDEVAKPAPLEKLKPEHMANVPIDRGQVIRAWIDGGGYPSDIATGLHSDHADEGDGNSRFHHSFWIAWQLVNARDAAADTGNTDELDRVIAQFEALLSALRDIRDARKAQQARG